MNRKRIFSALMLPLSITIASATPAEISAGRADGTQNAMDFLTALGHQDLKAAGLFLDENAVIDLPFAGDGLTVNGREKILQFFQRSMAASVGSIEYRLEHAYPDPATGTVILEISTQAHMKTGGDYTNRLVTIFQFQHGKILLFREYFNPARLSKIKDGPDSPEK